MRVAYLTSVFVHILAAVVWIGGMFFLILVVVPWLRQGDRATAGAFLRDTGLRFRTVGWVCFGLLLVTGLINLWLRGVPPAMLVDPAFLGTPFGLAVTLKILAFLAVVTVSAVHDFGVGPRATSAMRRDPGGPETARLRRWATLLGRVNALLALALVGLGVVLVRGWP